MRLNLPSMTNTPSANASPLQARPAGNWVPCAPGTGIKSPPKTTEEPVMPKAKTVPETPKPRREYQPKRLWCRFDQQPGRLFANDVPPNQSGSVVSLRPRQELTAKWVLSLKYLRQRAVEKELNMNSIQDALGSLTVGLFRRGCTENGSSSIISKEILAPSGETRSDYPIHVEQGSDVVWGTVPFYAPRTPGYVLFRLYWQDEPLYTLATGPTLLVRVGVPDFEPTLRFILSNFKSKKGSATSLSSLNALSTVLEQFSARDNPRQQYGQNRNPFDSAGRAAWGCVCESRKVLDACAAEYCKTKDKLKKLEAEVEALKLQKEEEDALADKDGEATNRDEKPSDSNEEGEEREATTAEKLKEKTHALMGGRAASERKWKDSQNSFSAILRVCSTRMLLSHH